MVTTNTRSPAAVGEVRTGDPTLFSHSFLPVLASSATTMPKPVAGIDAAAIRRETSAEAFLVLLIGRRGRDPP